MAVPICIPVDLAALRAANAAAAARLPGVGQLRALRDSLQKLPDPSKPIALMFNYVDQALTALRPIVLVLETILAIVNCINAVRDAFTQLSPDPITECVSNLRRVLDTLGEYLLIPLIYVRMMADIVLILVAYCDALVRAIGLIDSSLSQIDLARARAQTINDNQLVLAADCAEFGLLAQKEHLLGGLQTLGRLIGLILVFAKMIAGGSMDVDAAQQDMDTRNGQISTALPLGVAVDLILGIRNVLAGIHQILSMSVGEAVLIGPAPAIGQIQHTNF